MENDAARFEAVHTVDKDDPLSFIFSDMQQNEHLRESSELAEMIQAKLGTMQAPRHQRWQRSEKAAAGL